MIFGLESLRSLVCKNQQKVLNESDGVDEKNIHRIENDKQKKALLI